ncbi:ABC transporter ATP-binding protein [Roseateles cellulosilyticus]|uniref:ABC transporter ATP-binding protein n=1 Tax=Pelomonas cellulosilytica TaxID=2906762 RepID=A0ABS8XWH6_9BURK|nr:ABC transporter ATP-binding protein [Pelomonas sp. P8]MCE4555573.1 ABC transporter ATP-binding protein [Pelomonas sp. P8]
MTSPHFPHSDAASAALSQVTLRYPNGPSVLDRLDWQLLPGQVVGLLGRNGAGKTTLLETLLGLREPDAGAVQLFGQDALRLDDAARGRIGYVPQHSDLFEAFTPAQLLAYFRSFYPRWNDAKVEGLMSRWEIPRDQAIRKLSGGQKQRLSIIRALAHEPDLLVLDEPVASLDPAGRRDFLRELVGEVMDRGATVVFSTHILSDLERVAFNIAFLSRGRIALQAPLDELLEQVRAFTGSVTEMATLMARLGAQPLKRTPLEAGRERVLARLPADTTLPDSVAVDRVNLDDLFTELT